MAKSLKIDTKLFKKASKERKTQKIRVSFLIVCEGEKTEPNYFKKFSCEHKDVIFEIICEGEGCNTLSLVKKTIKIKYKNRYDKVWVVFDKDSFPDENFNVAISKAEANDICCAWSNEAFELWYLLHFQNRITAMSRDEYKKAIENEVNKKRKNKKKPFEYKKNYPEMYYVLKEYGNQIQAIKNAEKLSQEYKDKKYATHNPRTQVYELVKQLIRQDKELEDYIKSKTESD